MVLNIVDVVIATQLVCLQREENMVLCLVVASVRIHALIGRGAVLMAVQYVKTNY